MAFSIFLDLAILLTFASGSLLSHSRSGRLACALALFALASIDLSSQLSATAMDRLLLATAYPAMYSVMLFKNGLLLALAVFGIVKGVDFAATEREHVRTTTSLAHRGI